MLGILFGLALGIVGGETLAQFLHRAHGFLGARYSCQILYAAQSRVPCAFKIAAEEFGKRVTQFADAAHEGLDAVDEVVLDDVAQPFQHVPHRLDEGPESGKLVPACHHRHRQCGHHGGHQHKGVHRHHGVQHGLRRTPCGGGHRHALRHQGIGGGRYPCPVEHHGGGSHRSGHDAYHVDPLHEEAHDAHHRVGQPREDVHRCQYGRLYLLVYRHGLLLYLPDGGTPLAREGLCGRVHHTVELSALLCGVGYGCRHILGLDTALAHHLLQFLITLAGHRRQFLQRVEAGVDKLHQVLSRHLGGCAHLAEHQGKRVQLLRVAHRDVAQLLQRGHHPVALHAEVEHRLCGFLQVEFCEGRCGGKVVDLVQHLGGFLLVAHQHPEGGARHLGLCAKFGDGTYPGSDDGVGVHQKVHAGQTGQLALEVLQRECLAQFGLHPVGPLPDDIQLLGGLPRHAQHVAFRGLQLDEKFQYVIHWLCFLVCGCR